MAYRKTRSHSKFIVPLSIKFMRTEITKCIQVPIGVVYQQPDARIYKILLYGNTPSGLLQSKRVGFKASPKNFAGLT
jgi:hypothetical protein